MLSGQICVTEAVGTTQSEPFQRFLIPSANSERLVSLGDKRIALRGAEQAISPPGLQAGRGKAGE